MLRLAHGYTAALAALLLAADQPAAVFAHESATHQVAAEMAEAAQRFLQSLEEPERGQAVYPFDSPRRTFWHYVPSAQLAAQGGRPGLAIKAMRPEQRALAQGLLSTAPSHQGYLQAMTIMALDAILRDLEQGNPVRDPELYHFAVFGTPSTEKTWGWACEGHHLAVHITIVDGQEFSVTPSFFGSNPAVVKDGPQAGLETLQAERELALKLVGSFSAEQRKRAVIAEKAPADIATRADPAVSKDRFQPPQGIACSELTPEQQELLVELVSQYVLKYRPEIVAQVQSRAPLVGRDSYFAWAGGTAPGEGSYFRIQTPDFLFEYDNTQNGANHVHTVWRQFDGDFGADLLRRHYETAPHHQHE